MMVDAQILTTVYLSGKSRKLGNDHDNANGKPVPQSFGLVECRWIWKLHVDPFHPFAYHTGFGVAQRR